MGEREELLALAACIDGWHDCASGQPENGNGHFRVTTLSDSEQTRLNLRATLRDAATAIRTHAQGGVTPPDLDPSDVWDDYCEEVVREDRSPQGALAFGVCAAFDALRAPDAPADGAVIELLGRLYEVEKYTLDHLPGDMSPDEDDEPPFTIYGEAAAMIERLAALRAPEAADAGAVALGDELNALFDSYLNNPSASARDRAATRLRSSLWDNKAGIIAHLRASPAADAGIAAPPVSYCSRCGGTDPTCYICAAPPAASADAVRERIARLIEPRGWNEFDRGFGNLGGQVEADRIASLSVATKILDVLSAPVAGADAGMRERAALKFCEWLTGFLDVDDEITSFDAETIRSEMRALALPSTDGNTATDGGSERMADAIRDGVFRRQPR